MARSFVSSITRPLSSLASPLLRPAMRLARHPLAPLGMGVAGMVVEGVAEQVGFTPWITKLGVQGVELLKGGAQTGLKAVAGVIDFDGEDEPAKETKTETKKTDVAGTPNAYEAATGLHIGCAGDKACGPCAKKQALAKVGAAFDKMSEKEVEAFVVGLSRPAIPRTHSAIASQANNAASSYQAQIAALQAQLVQAQDAVQQQALTDQIAALQSQLSAANSLAANAQAGGGLAGLLAQLTQLKSIEALLTPAAPAQDPSYGAPPWGYEENTTVIQDPNGIMYDPTVLDEDPSGMVDPMAPFGYGDPYGDDPMVTRGVDEDYDAVLAVEQETALDGDESEGVSGGTVSEYMQPQGDEGEMTIDVESAPEVVLDDEIDCDSCQRIY